MWNKLISTVARVTGTTIKTAVDGFKKGYNTPVKSTSQSTNDKVYDNIMNNLKKPSVQAGIDMCEDIQRVKDMQREGA